MTFADITIVPVPSGHKAGYLAFSRRMAAVYREHGATSIVEYWQAATPSTQDGFHADNVSYEPGALRGIASIVGASDTESVVVTVTEWPSREAHARGNAAATRDHRVLATVDEEPVFEGHRLVADSFELVMRTTDDR